MKRLFHHMFSVVSRNIRISVQKPPLLFFNKHHQLNGLLKYHLQTLLFPVFSPRAQLVAIVVYTCYTVASDWSVLGGRIAPQKTNNSTRFDEAATLKQRNVDTKPQPACYCTHKQAKSACKMQNTTSHRHELAALT